MDKVDVFDEHGRRLRSDVYFVRAPMVGEWVPSLDGPGIVQVRAVFHGAEDGQPRIGIQIDTQSHAMGPPGGGDRP